VAELFLFYYLTVNQFYKVVSATVDSVEYPQLQL
jgi:hypothetical protein